MRRKRKPTPTQHEKQLRFFAIFFGALLVLLMVVMLWFLNRPRY